MRVANGRCDYSRRDRKGFAVRTTAIVIGALLGAVAGAAAGAYIRNVWIAEPMEADDFGRRLAKLEAEIEELEHLQRERKRRAGTGAAGGRIHSPALAGMRGSSEDARSMDAL
jgi:hypothetical protein